MFAIVRRCALLACFAMASAPTATATEPETADLLQSVEARFAAYDQQLSRDLDARILENSRRMTQDVLARSVAALESFDRYQIQLAPRRARNQLANLSAPPARGVPAAMR